MKIRVWNAYASNNSGSYTIVGSLPSAKVAREVAADLAAMVEAHTAWYEAGVAGRKLSESPLAEFCRAHGLPWKNGDGGSDDWPEHSEDNRPKVVAVGAQVIVHHDYTVSLPPTFGAFFYKRGGRVQHEENHAHHPLVVIATFWWGWTKEETARQEAELPGFVAAMTSAEGILAGAVPPQLPAAWQMVDGRYQLVVGAVFADVLEGVRALHALAERHGAKMHVRLSEAPSEEQDPLAHLRPSAPPPAVPRYDVVVSEVGVNRPGVVGALAGALGYYDGQARGLLLNLPVTVAKSLWAPRAEAAAAALRKAGAAAELVRNDR